MIYIWYNLFVILYDGVMFLRVTWYLLFTVGIVCRVSPYLQWIMTTRSFIVAVNLFIVMLIVAFPPSAAADCYI